MDKLINDIETLVSYLRASGKEHIAVGYEEALSGYRGDLDRAHLAKRILECGIDGKRCSYSYLEDRLIGDIATMARRIT